MNFDIAVVQTTDGREQTLTPAEFQAVPLGDRIQWMTASRVKFYRGGQQISPLEAVRRPVTPPA